MSFAESKAPTRSSRKVRRITDLAWGQKSELMSEQDKEKIDLAIAKWMIDASIPFDAVNSIYFQPMIDAICSMGPGYKVPTMHTLRGSLLSKLVDVEKKILEDYREVWKRTGCTLMADESIDRCGRTIINFFAYCPKGIAFLKSVDASHACKSEESLYRLFRKIVLFVGPENVVHIVTNNAPNYVAAGKLLEAEFPKLFWSPCAAHCIKLMLHDIGKLEEVSETMSHASKITKYIYNHCYILYLMRKHTCGREILRFDQTHFATDFIALHSILAQKDALRAMVTSREWTSSAYAKEAKGKRFVDQVLDSRFWKRCLDIVKLTAPLVHVLRIVNSEDKPAMGFVYQAIYKAREEMVRRFQRNKMVDPYLLILDKHWASHLYKNLYAAGYRLNPSCQVNVEECQKHMSTTSGLLDVIEKFAPGDIELQLKFLNEMTTFENAVLDFRSQVAPHERNTIMPGDWWEAYGHDMPNLQKLAIRVLSQTCSASGCELNWSLFEHLHSNKRNRVEHQRLVDRVFVHCNLRLRQRNHLRHRDYDPINFETLDDHSNWVLEESPPFLTNKEVELLRTGLANMTTQPISDDIDQLNLDDDEDDDPQDNTMGNVNQNGSNIGEAYDFFDEERMPELNTILTPWP